MKLAAAGSSRSTSTEAAFFPLPSAEKKRMLDNILDTPGHQDFSEDTYRTLMAADSAVMVIDGAKGVCCSRISVR